MRLLIVEDETDLRNVLKKRLEKEHYSVDACKDGLEAMDYIDMTSYDGMILDIMVPGKDGLEILKEVILPVKTAHSTGNGLSHAGRWHSIFQYQRLVA